MPALNKHRPFHLHPDNSFLFLTATIYNGFPYLYPKKTKNYFYQLLKEKAQKNKIELNGWVILNNHYHLIIKTIKGSAVSKFIKEVHGASARFIKKNIPDLVSAGEQVLIKTAAPWDKRQDQRLEKEYRRLKSAITGWSGRRLKSAITDNSVLANFSSRPESFELAKFISRYKNRFSPADYCRLKSAITKGRITSPEILIALISKECPVWYQYFDHVIRNEKDYYQHLNYIHQNPVKHNLVKKMSKYQWSSIREFIKNKGKEWVIDCFREYPIIDFRPHGIAD